MKYYHYNLPTGKEHNFRKILPNLWTPFGTPYDYFSIMHYDGKAFSANRKNTITSKTNGVRTSYTSSSSLFILICIYNKIFEVIAIKGKKEERSRNRFEVTFIREKSA